MLLNWDLKTAHKKLRFLSVELCSTIFRWGTIGSKIPSSISMAEMSKFKHCSDYVLSRGYNTRSPTHDEIDFPIAYEGVI